MSPETLARLAPAELEDAIGQLQGLSNAALARMLTFIAAYDALGAWAPDGATSMAAWASARLGLSHGTAAEYVRVAHAFEQLPAIAAAFSDGRLSWDQARAVTLFATPESDAELAASVPGRSAAHLAGTIASSKKKDGGQAGGRDLAWCSSGPMDVRSTCVPRRCARTSATASSARPDLTQRSSHLV